MRKVVELKLKFYVPRYLFCAVAYAVKLVVIDEWGRKDAVLQACDFYDACDPADVMPFVDRVLEELLFRVIEIPDGVKVGDYIKRLDDGKKI